MPTFPQRVRASLDQVGVEGLDGVLATEGRECVGAKFHSPNPLVLHEIEVAGDAVLLCGTCSANLQVLQHLLRQNDGDLPWTVRREFGNLIRALALREWPDPDPDENEEASA